MGSSHPNIVPYGTIFTTAEGKELVLAVGNDGQFRRLCEVLELPNLPGKEEFASNGARVRNRGLLEPILRTAISGWTREELLEALHRHQVPAGAVNNLQEACAQPQAEELLLEGGERKAFRTIALEQVPKLDLLPPPSLASATDAVLREWLGISTEKSQDLRNKKAIL
jgi:crotonobetainyl-CoA:carnitine CoA-transferase CaiB-like acyl-CoA transferase